MLCRINEQKTAMTESKESLLEKQRLEVCAHIARLSRTLEDMVTFQNIYLIVLTMKNTSHVHSFRFVNFAVTHL